MRLWYGGDYNPEQWPQDILDEDVRLMRRAGVTVATVGVFSWAQLEPRDGEYDFGWLDRILDLLHAGGVRVDLATATASPPAWLSHAHPETLPVTREGVTLWPGSRQHYSASSAVYRRYAARLVRALAERYGAHPAVAAWHIGNEFGNDNPRDYSDVAAASFREWLEDKYSDIENLNRAWGTAFWSQRYGSFDEILPPRSTPTFGNPAHLLDFERFSSDEHLACFIAEAEILREVAPGIPITTNFMGFFRHADYWKWAEHVDFVSDDAYPDPAVPGSHVDSAMQRDLMRSLGSGRPWILMEQATSAVNWREINAPKRPGQMRATSYQAIARGADGIMFFQWRQAVRGAEKFHSAMLPVQGTDHRIWREVESLGAELELLEHVVGERVDDVRVAIVFDWDSWWSIEQQATPARLDYIDGISTWYRALFEWGVVTDFARPGADLSGYDVVIVPSLFVAEETTLAELHHFAGDGGHLLVTYLTGITDPEARFLGQGFLGDLGPALGVRVDEFAPRADASDAVEIVGELRGGYRTYAEFITVFDAEVKARFATGALAGHPAITRRDIGRGAGWYVAAQLDARTASATLRAVLDEAGVPVAADSPSSGVEVVRRGDTVFAINHGDRTHTVALTGESIIGPEVTANGVQLEPLSVAVVRTTNVSVAHPGPANHR